MTTRIQILRSNTAGNRPASKQYGEPYVNFADNQFGIFDSGNVARDLIGAPIFSTLASYVSGNPVNYQGKLYVANTTISAGAWNASQWTQVTGSGGGGGSNLVFLGSQSASGSASIDFTGIDGTYDEYLFIGDGITASTASVDFSLRVSQDNGATWKTTNSYHYAGQYNSDSPTNTWTSTGAGLLISLTAVQTTVANIAANVLSFQTKLSRPALAGIYKHIFSETSWIGQGGGFNVARVAGAWQGDTNAINAIRFFMTSGNIATGTISLYGLAKIPPLGSTPAAYAYGGLLKYVSATALSFAPYQGSYIILNGAAYPIPSGGIAGVTNTGVFVNGVAGQNLAASTLYYVYCFNNAGVLTADFSTTAHATSTSAGNIGTEIKSGDDTRTLLGMVRTNASSQFADSAAQRFVRSWFNRRSAATCNNFTVDRNTSSASVVEVNSEIRNEALLWVGESWQITLAGTVSNNTAGARTFGGIGIDSATAVASGTFFHSAGASQAGALSATDLEVSLTEGYHYATVVGSVSSGTSTFYATNNRAVALSGLTV